jgi:hydroxymethylglutaryl-CoA lyase
MLANMGIATGIDLDRLLALRSELAGWLSGETLHGSLWRAGLPKAMAQRSARAQAEAQA